MKRWWASLVTKELQTNTAMWQYHTATKIDKIKMTDQMLVSRWENQNTLTLLKECKLVQSHWKTVWSCLLKLSICILYDSLIPLLDIHPSENNDYTKILEVWYREYILGNFPIDWLKCKILYFEISFNHPRNFHSC